MEDCDVVSSSNFLKSRRIPIPSTNQWLQSCVQFFKSEHPTSSQVELHKFVFEQWTLADLKDIACPTIPEAVKNEPLYTLTQPCAVQIHYACNVAASASKQLSKIRRPDSEGNLEVSVEPIDKTSGDRALKLEMSDGVNEVVGFEDQPIPQLPDNLLPGTKALLIGSIECFKGVLMLNSGNIVMLGGEVDTLHVKYALENVLARALNVDENPDPYRNSAPQVTAQCTDDETFRLLINQIESQQALLLNSLETVKPDSQSTTLIGSNNEIAALDVDDETLLLVADQIESQQTLLPNSIETVKPATQSTLIGSNNEIVALDDDNETLLLVADQIESQMSQRILPSSVETTKPPTQPSLSHSQSEIAALDLIDFDFDDDFEMVAVQTAATAERNQSLPSPIHPSKKQKTQASIDSFVSSQKKTTPSTSTQETSFINPGPSSIGSSNSENPMKLKQAMSQAYGNTELPFTTKETPQKSPILAEGPSPSNPFPPSRLPAVVTVDGEVLKLTNRLSLKNEKWSLCGLVKAKGLQIEVEFSSDALDKIFGITGQALMSKKKEVQSNPAMKEKINEILRKSQQKIRTLKCPMVFKFTKASQKPVIIDVHDSS